jgi:hypothetical protein
MRDPDIGRASMRASIGYFGTRRRDFNALMGQLITTL